MKTEKTRMIFGKALGRRGSGGGLRLAGAALVLGASVLGGCKNVSKAQYESVMNENEELRNRLAAEQAARKEAETRNGSLEQENRDMAGKMDRPGDTGFGGIPGVRGARTSDGEVVVDIAGDVLFDSGQATLKASAKKTLDQVAGVLNSRYGGNVIRVEGYTDTDPIRKSKWQSNERLSGERAMAVENYLVSKGVSRDRIYFAGFGAANPKNSKKDSRRVEIVILANR